MRDLNAERPVHELFRMGYYRYVQETLTYFCRRKCVAATVVNPPAPRVQAEARIAGALTWAAGGQAWAENLFLGPVSVVLSCLYVRLLSMVTLVSGDRRRLAEVVLGLLDRWAPVPVETTVCSRDGRLEAD